MKAFWCPCFVPIILCSLQAIQTKKDLRILPVFITTTNKCTFTADGRRGKFRGWSDGVFWWSNGKCWCEYGRRNDQFCSRSTTFCSSVDTLKERKKEQEPSCQHGKQRSWWRWKCRYRVGCGSHIQSIGTTAATTGSTADAADFRSQTPQAAGFYISTDRGFLRGSCLILLVSDHRSSIWFGRPVAEQSRVAKRSHLAT